MSSVPDARWSPLILPGPVSGAYPHFTAEAQEIALLGKEAVCPTPNLQFFPLPYAVSTANAPAKVVDDLAAHLLSLSLSLGHLTIKKTSISLAFVMGISARKFWLQNQKWQAG